MEQFRNDLHELLSKSNPGLGKSNQFLEKIISYINILEEENGKYNLTGFKTTEDIYNNLIAETIRPVVGMNVPCGTIMDIGSGNGVPGILLSILFPENRVILVDSNNKKCSFLKIVKEDLLLENVSVIYDRIENVVELYRDKIDMVFSRAFGVYYTIEYGLPVLKVGGCMYIYSKDTDITVQEDIKSHADAVGGMILNEKNYRELGLEYEGLLIKKVNKTDMKYPRKFPLVKKESDRLKGLQK